MASLNCSVEADQAVMTLTGDVDVAVADAVRNSGFSCLQKADKVLVIDLAAVTFIDSSGLGAVVAVRNRAQAEGKTVTLRAVPRRVRQVLALTHLDDIFTIVE